MKSWIAGVVATIVVALATAAILLTSGIFDVAADTPHWQGTAKILEFARERSVAYHASGIKVPDLSNPQLIRTGAGEYAEMCVHCHLAPGMANTEIRPGLNPQPPELSKYRTDPASAFWIIKHGIKMTGMPAWGGSHDDETIWSMVSFLQKMPEMNAAQYQEMAATAPDHDEVAAGHPHDKRAAHEDAGHKHTHSH